MYLLDLPERLWPALEAHREAERRHDPLRDRPPDDPEKRAAWEALEATPNPAYLCLNADGMALVRLAMLNAEMLAAEGSPLPLPALEHLPTTTLDGERFHPDLGYPDELCTPEQIAWMDALDRWRRYRPEGNIGIQAWKLRSNDLWIVTAEECAEAVRAWESLEQQCQQAILELAVAADVTESDPSRRSLVDAAADAFNTTDEHRFERGRRKLSVVLEGHRSEVERFTVRWDRWLGYLRLGAEGDGFKVT
jgi:hypothetical protein